MCLNTVQPTTRCDRPLSNFILQRGVTYHSTVYFPPFNLVPKDALPKMCADEVDDEDEGQVLERSDRGIDPIK